MLQWLEWRRSELDLEPPDEREPGNVCRVWRVGPIAVNPVPATQVFLTDNSDVTLTTLSGVPLTS